MGLKYNIGNTATPVQAATRRCYGHIRNASDEDMWIAIDGDSGVTTDAGARPGILLRAGRAMIFGDAIRDDRAFDQAIYAIHGGTGNKVLVLNYV